MISTFFDSPQNVSAVKLAEVCCCKVIGNDAAVVNNFATLGKAKSNELSFFGNVKYLAELKATHAGIVILDEKYIDYLPSSATALVCKNVMAAYAKAVEFMCPAAEKESNIASTAIIDESAIIGKNVSIGEYVVVGKGAVIGDGCSIDCYTKVGDKVQIGVNCRIASHVSIEYAILGDCVFVHSGAKIGQAGFGIVPDGDRMVYIRQLGRVIIGNHVRIGANTTIDRGAIDDTIIGDETIIDNLVQIAHNVNVGRMVTLVAQVGIAGSSVIGDRAVLAGQVGVAGHVTVGKNAIVAAKSGIASSVKDGSIVGGIPAVDIMVWKRQSAFLKKAVSKKDA